MFIAKRNWHPTFEPALNGEPYYAGYTDARSQGGGRGYQFGAKGGTEQDDQYVRSGMYFVVRTTSDPMGMSAVIKAAVAEVDRNTAVADLRTAGETINNQPTEVVVLLAHSWELVDLKDKISGLPEGYARGCSSDLKALESILRALREKVRFSPLDLVAQEWLEKRKANR